MFKDETDTFVQKRPLLSGHLMAVFDRFALCYEGEIYCTHLSTLIPSRGTAPNPNLLERGWRSSVSESYGHVDTLMKASVSVL